MDDLEALLSQMRIIGGNHLLVAAAFCRRIGLMVNRVVPTGMDVDVGSIVQDMVLDTLSGRSPLYRLAAGQPAAAGRRAAGLGLQRHDRRAGHGHDLRGGGGEGVLRGGLPGSSTLPAGLAYRALGQHVGECLGRLRWRQSRRDFLCRPEPDPLRVARLRQGAGCFVLLSNVPEQGSHARTGPDLLRAYKDQQAIERNFSFLKAPLIVNDLFLKKPERIEALGAILLISLLVWNLIEHCLRQHVEQTGAALPGWDRKETLWPTTFMMTTKFAGLQIVRIGERYRLAQPLRDVQAATSGPSISPRRLPVGAYETTMRPQHDRQRGTAVVKPGLWTCSPLRSLSPPTAALQGTCRPFRPLCIPRRLHGSPLSALLPTASGKPHTQASSEVGNVR